MKRLLRPAIVIVGTAALALLGWSTVSAASAARAHHVVIQQVASENEPAASATAEPEAQQENAAPSPGANEPEPEPAENQPAEHETPAPPTAAAPPATSMQSFSLVGGNVTFSCTGSSISLTSAVPAAGFRMETESEDGATQIDVKFESDSHKSEIKAACAGGQVQATELREESE